MRHLKLTCFLVQVIYFKQTTNTAKFLRIRHLFLKTETCFQTEFNVHSHFIVIVILLY